MRSANTLELRDTSLPVGWHWVGDSAAYHCFFCILRETWHNQEYSTRQCTVATHGASPCCTAGASHVELVNLWWLQRHRSVRLERSQHSPIDYEMFTVQALGHWLSSPGLSTLTNHNGGIGRVPCCAWPGRGPCTRPWSGQPSQAAPRVASVGGQPDSPPLKRPPCLAQGVAARGERARHGPLQTDGRAAPPRLAPWPAFRRRRRPRGGTRSARRASDAAPSGRSGAADRQQRSNDAGARRWWW